MVAMERVGNPYRCPVAYIKAVCIITCITLHAELAEVCVIYEVIINRAYWQLWPYTMDGDSIVIAMLTKDKAEGCTIVDITDKAPWVAACEEVITKNTSDQAELYATLVGLQ